MEGSPALDQCQQKKAFLFHGGHSLRARIDFPLEIPANRRGAKKEKKWVFHLMRNAQSE